MKRRKICWVKTRLACLDLEVIISTWMMLISTLLGVCVFFWIMEVNDINKVILILVLIRNWLAYQDLEANDNNMNYVDIDITWCLFFLTDHGS
jgi:hypothetical protein